MDRDAQFGEQHLAYPVLQYYPARQAAKSPIIALVRLEQLVAAAQHGIPPAPRPPYLLLKVTRSSIDQIVQVPPQDFTRHPAGELPLPALSTDELASGLKSRGDTRRKLASLIRSHDWRHRRPGALIANPKSRACGNTVAERESVLPNVYRIDILQYYITALNLSHISPHATALSPPVLPTDGLFHLARAGKKLD